MRLSGHSLVVCTLREYVVGIVTAVRFSLKRVLMHLHALIQGGRWVFHCLVRGKTKFKELGREGGCGAGSGEILSRI